MLSSSSSKSTRSSFSSSSSSSSSMSEISSFTSSRSSLSSRSRSSISSLSRSSISSLSSKHSSSTIEIYSSSDSSFTSSSSSIVIYSSSSSSLFDHHDSKIIPFIFNSNADKTIYSMAFYKDYVFAATSDSGMVIKSSNRFTWENFYQTDDTIVTALYVVNDYLFIGTSPHAKIYKINLVTFKVTEYSGFNGKTIAFSELPNADPKDKVKPLYFTTSLPSNVYKYDNLNDKWDLFYKPYTGEINQVKVLGSKMYLACRGENIISFNGDKWNIEVNIATVRSVSTSLFSHSTFDFINSKSIIKTSSLEEEMILDVFPYNRTIGIKSLSFNGNSLLMGAMNRGRIFNYDGSKIHVIFDTEGKEVYDLLNIDATATLASIDNKLYLIYNGDISDKKVSNKEVLDESLSSNSIVNIAENVTENVVPVSAPTNNYSGIPILELPLDEHIEFMTKDKSEGVLFSTSKGRVLSCSKKMFNAYLTGERTVYAEVWDGYSNKSSLVLSNFTYALYNRILEITQDKSITKTRFLPNATLYSCDKITAEFISPILFVKQDMGLWKEIVWEENKPSNCEIIICIRTSDSSDGLLVSPWRYCFQSELFESGIISRTLSNINIKGKYMQLKVEMISHSQSISPMVANISVKYSTKKSCYFFTEKFSLENGTDIKNGLMIANITKPINTEVNFGITDKNSVDWNDYEIIEPDKLFAVKDYKNVKVGIKFIADGDVTPSVDEFALIFGDEKKQIINP